MPTFRSSLSFRFVLPILIRLQLPVVTSTLMILLLVSHTMNLYNALLRSTQLFLFFPLRLISSVPPHLSLRNINDCWDQQQPKKRFSGRTQKQVLDYVKANPEKTCQPFERSSSLRTIPMEQRIGSQAELLEGSQSNLPSRSTPNLVTGRFSMTSASSQAEMMLLTSPKKVERSHSAQENYNETKPLVSTEQENNDKRISDGAILGDETMDQITTTGDDEMGEDDMTVDQMLTQSQRTLQTSSYECLDQQQITIDQKVREDEDERMTTRASTDQAEDMTTGIRDQKQTTQTSSSQSLTTSPPHHPAPHPVPPQIHRNGRQSIDGTLSSSSPVKKSFLMSKAERSASLPVSDRNLLMPGNKRIGSDRVNNNNNHIKRKDDLKDNKHHHDDDDGHLEKSLEDILRRDNQKFIDDVLNYVLREPLVRKKSNNSIKRTEKEETELNQNESRIDDHQKKINDNLEASSTGPTKSESVGRSRSCIRKKRREKKPVTRTKSEFRKQTEPNFHRRLFARADYFGRPKTPATGGSSLEPSNQISQQMMAFVSVRSLPSLDSYSYRDDTLADPLEEMIQTLKKKFGGDKNRKRSDDDSSDPTLAPADHQTEGTTNDDSPLRSQKGREVMFDLTASADLMDQLDLDYESEYDSMEFLTSAAGVKKSQEIIKNLRMERNAIIAEQIISSNLKEHFPDNLDVRIFFSASSSSKSFSGYTPFQRPHHHAPRQHPPPQHHQTSTTTGSKEKGEKERPSSPTSSSSAEGKSNKRKDPHHDPSTHGGSYSSSQLIDKSDDDDDDENGYPQACSSSFYYSSHFLADLLVKIHLRETHIF